MGSDVRQHSKDDLVVARRIDIVRVRVEQRSKSRTAELPVKAVNIQCLEFVDVGKVGTLGIGGIDIGNEAVVNRDDRAVHTGSVAIYEGDILARMIDKPDHK